MSFAMLSLAVALLLVTGAPSEARAYCQMTTVASSPTDACVAEGIPLSWRRPCIEYAIDMRGSVDLELEAIEQVLAQSFATWAAVECGGQPLGFQFRAADAFADCREASFRTDGGNVNVVAFVPDLDEARVLALTTVWYSTQSGEIFDADVMINETQGPFGTCPAPGCFGVERAHDLENLVTHELGHFLGLGHSEHGEATMFATSARGETLKRDLAEDDVAGLCATYLATPLPAQCDFRPHGGRDLSCGQDDGGGCSCGIAPAASAPPPPWPLAGLVLASIGAAFVRRKARPRT